MRPSASSARSKPHQRLLDNEAEDSFSKLPTKEKGAKVDPAMAAYENYLRKMSNRLTPQEIEAIRNTMSTTTGSGGWIHRAARRGEHPDRGPEGLCAAPPGGSSGHHQWLGPVVPVHRWHQ